MADTTSSSASGGTSIAGLLGITFIVLKLTGVIDWPWVWVLAPFWVGLALLVVILLIMLIVWAAIRYGGRWQRDRRARKARQ